MPVCRLSRLYALIPRELVRSMFRPFKYANIEQWNLPDDTLSPEAVEDSTVSMSSGPAIKRSSMTTTSTDNLPRLCPAVSVASQRSCRMAIC
eukprot:45959-Eustigmatos_ZCMA.PRE.1